jgi:hypothetical protein
MAGGVHKDNNSSLVPGKRGVTSFLYYFCVNWNDAAEDFLNQILGQTPRPMRDAMERELQATAQAIAEEDGKDRVNVETVIAAWVRNTPEALRPDLPRQMERFGLDPGEYRSLLE